MHNLATWMRPKDEKWFRPFFAKHPDIHVFDARKGDAPMDQMDGLLLTGGSDITPEFLRQEDVDPTLIDKDDLIPSAIAGNLTRFEEALIAWAADSRHLQRYSGLQCRSRRHAQARYSRASTAGTERQDIQLLRYDAQREASFRKRKQLASSGDRSLSQTVSKSKRGALMTTSSSKCACAIIRLRCAVQYHPERGKIYDALFEDFFVRLKSLKR